MRPECLATRREVLRGDDMSEVARGHLSGCAACRGFEASERIVSRLVRERAERPSAPHALRDRLVVALESERRRARRGGRRRWPRWTASVALLAVLAGGLAWLQRRQNGHAEARLMVETLAEDHLAYAARDGRAEVVSSSPDEVSDWLRARTGFAVSVPALPGASLLGARRCKVRGRPAALAFYDRQRPAGGRGSPLSLFAFETDREDWSHMQRLDAVHPKRLCRADEKGLTVLVWEDRGLTYALVSDVPESDIPALAGTL